MVVSCFVEMSSRMRAAASSSGTHRADAAVRQMCAREWAWKALELRRQRSNSRCGHLSKAAASLRSSAPDSASISDLGAAPHPPLWNYGDSALILDAIIHRRLLPVLAVSALDGGGVSELGAASPSQGHLLPVERGEGNAGTINNRRCSTGRRRARCRCGRSGPGSGRVGRRAAVAW